MFKQQFGELLSAVGMFLFWMLVVTFCVIWLVGVLIGNILAVFGFNGPIDTIIAAMTRMLTDVYGAENAEALTNEFRIVGK